MAAQKTPQTANDGFAAVGHSRPRWLILGSLPGQKSLCEKAYYAHPRNAFWPIMAALFDIDYGAEYPERYRQLSDHHIMLWDVIARAHRPGSLDASINKQGLRINDFSFITQTKELEAVICNGGKAFELFAKHVAKPQLLTLPVVKMPSTSPAYAALTIAEKVEAWRNSWPF